FIPAPGFRKDRHSKRRCARRCRGTTLADDSPPVITPMLFRLLLLAAAAIVVWRLLQSLGVLAPPRGRPGAEQEFDPMARCARCGTYLPVKALSADGRCGRCKE